MVTNPYRKENTWIYAGSCVFPRIDEQTIVAWNGDSITERAIIALMSANPPWLVLGLTRDVCHRKDLDLGIDATGETS